HLSAELTMSTALETRLASAPAGRIALNPLAALRGSNRQLTAGLLVMLAIVLFGLVGPLVVDVRGARVGSAMPDQPPSVTYPLGTDSVGRQILPAIVAGTPLTLRIGLIAGTIGLGVGVTFGLIAGYFGGLWDT